MCYCIRGVSDPISRSRISDISTAQNNAGVFESVMSIYSKLTVSSTSRACHAV